MDSTLLVIPADTKDCIGNLSEKFYQLIHFVMSDPITENSGMSMK
jgi:hypothetical protein